MPSKTEQQSSANSKKKYLYNRLLFYPFIIIIFIFATHKLQKYTTHISQNSAYQYAQIHPKFEEQNNFDVNYYDIGLNITIDSLQKGNYLTGDVSIILTATEDDLQKIVLNFSSHMHIDSIRNVKRYHHEDNLIVAELKSKLQRNQVDSIRIFYRGIPRPYHNWVFGWKYTQYNGWNYERTPWISTMNPPFGAQTWFPCKDTPADKADSLQLRVTIPDTLMAVCNGRLIRQENLPDGRKLFIWRENYPIATYLISVNIGKFYLFEDIYHPVHGSSFPLQIYTFQTDTPLVELVLEQLKYMMDFFIGILGPYPYQSEKYAMIEYPNTGGMENQTLSGVSNISLNSENLYAHELAHQWLGNMITQSSFHESWINEGLATYFTGLYIKEKQGPAAFKTFMNSRKYSRNGSMYIHQSHVPDSVYHTGRVYDRGCWFFYMLHQKLGDSVFFSALKNGLTRYAYGSIDSKKLQNIFEEISGKNLSHFFYQWIYEKEIPHIIGSLKQQKSSNNQYEYLLKLEQIQKSKKPFALEIEIEFRSATSDTIMSFNLDKRVEKFKLTFDSIVYEMTIDPNGKLLLTAEERL
ncbi:MAG: M1 family metallopeptidase [Calditrichia bacterium]